MVAPQRKPFRIHVPFAGIRAAMTVDHRHNARVADTPQSALLIALDSSRQPMPGIQHGNELSLIGAKSNSRDGAKKHIIRAELKPTDKFQCAEPRFIRAGLEGGNYGRADICRTTVLAIIAGATPGKQRYENCCR
ncbi:hypothetical protein thsrh120_41210 [Rhizobium sp. No.120]